MAATPIRRNIPTQAWTLTVVDGQEVWVYHNAGHNVDLSLSLTNPTQVGEVEHKNIFDKED